MNYFPEEKVTPMEAQETEKKEETAAEKKKSIGFAVWNVGGTGYQLKLSTAGIKELESRYKTNVINLMQPQEGESLPPLTVMLDVTHVALKPWSHGVKAKDVEALFDRYMEEGGSQLGFYAEVYMEIFMVSGFFSKTMAKDLSETMEKAREDM